MPKLILIVDDEADIRSMLAQVLSAHGYRTVDVASKAEALAACRKETPDLVMSDYQLERGDGLEMIAEIKTALPHIPAILLTGVLFDPDVVSKVIATKVSCYLPKTSPLSKILETVRGLIGPATRT